MFYSWVMSGESQHPDGLVEFLDAVCDALNKQIAHLTSELEKEIANRPATHYTKFLDTPDAIE